MTVLQQEARIDTRQAARVWRRLGYTAAVVSAVCGFLYLLGLVGNFLTTGSVYAATSRLQAISAIIALVWNQTLVVLFAALRWQVREDKQVFADLALVFAGMMSAVSSVNWFAQLAVVPKIDNAAILALLDAHGSGSLLFAMEHLGWGLFFAIAVLSAAFAIQGGRLEGWICWLLAAGGILSLAHLVGVVGGDALLSFLGYPAWGMLLPAASVLFAIRFKRA